VGYERVNELRMYVGREEWLRDLENDAQLPNLRRRGGGSTDFA